MPLVKRLVTRPVLSLGVPVVPLPVSPVLEVVVLTVRAKCDSFFKITAPFQLIAITLY